MPFASTSGENCEENPGIRLNVACAPARRRSKISDSAQRSASSRLVTFQQFVRNCRPILTGVAFALETGFDVVRRQKSISAAIQQNQGRRFGTFMNDIIVVHSSLSKSALRVDGRLSSLALKSSWFAHDDQDSRGFVEMVVMDIC